MKVQITKHPEAKFADLAVGDAFLFSQDETTDVFMKTYYISATASGDSYNCVNLVCGNLDYADGYETVYPLHNATLTIS